MIRGAAGSIEALESRPERGAVARSRPAPSGSRGRARRADDRYSRRVALLKRLLPLLGLTLLTLVAMWPRLGPLLESVRLVLPVIDLREARDLRMLNPRYAGVDRFNRPYVITAAIGRQVPNRDDLMSLERPRGEMTLRRGALIVVTAATAVYQPQAQLLDLFEDVNLVHENGTRFVTKTAHVDVSANTAEGNDPVSGRGPSGDIDAQGFRILDKGDTIIFTGKSDLLLKGSKPSSQPAVSPPGLPPEVADTAARIEAAAIETTAAPLPLSAASDGADAAVFANSPGKSATTGSGSRAVAKPDLKLPAEARKAKNNDG
jgi:lipopolysaccharide export system protein LptC